MKRIASILAMVAAAVVALLVIQPATAGARTAGINTGPMHFAFTEDGEGVKVDMKSGKVAVVGNNLLFSNAQGKVKDRVPLSVKNQDGTSVPLAATVAANGKSVVLKPVAKKKGLKYQPLKTKISKQQAYDQMMYVFNRNSQCIGIAALIGGIIGFFVFFVGVLIGAAIGAAVGVGNCGSGTFGGKRAGETFQAFNIWWNK